ncbi:hypothetical protein [Limnoglobus roseus]|uniref:Uncharacterized protein n=1 Tax=Limnoglobus roseus TaxID=2598579 RepID=A0A5C1AGX4_9BACT|nr:hypothetical protein [Limnoglobus roseus]QEL17236.1 hypothetical protein PX52LOC_04219 [Limnoglobus roseus]
MAKGRKSGPSRLDLRRQSEAAEAREGEEKVEVEDDDEIEDDDEAEEEDEADDEAAEASDDDEGGGDDDDEDAPKKKKSKAKAKVKKEVKPKAKRTRAVKVVTMKAVWVVFDNSNKRLNTFAYNAKAEAEDFLAKKQEEKKGTCYMQLVKEEMKA